MKAFTGIIALLALLLGSCARAPRHNGTNVLLIVLDTVRADRLSCYNETLSTTPRIDAIAERGVRFENFYANAPWTLASHASLFTGMYPAGHRATQETLRLSEEPPTMSEIFANVGYETFGASANGVVSVASGLARGFDTFVETFRSEYRESVKAEDGHFNNIALRRFLESSSRDKPFFAFLNYIAAHAPYDPPEPHRSQFLDPGLAPEQVREAMGMRMADHYMRGAVTDAHFEIMNQLYNGEINYLDRWVSDLIDILRRAGRLENTIIVITSDHGENLGEHGDLAHVFSIWNTLLEIPLIVVFPDGSHAGEVRSDTGQLLDLFPTILNACGVDHDPRPEARDLFAPAAAETRGPVMAEYYYPRQVLSIFDEEELLANFERFVPYMRRLRAIVDEDMKLIWGSDGMHRLYDLNADPAEVNDLLESDPHHAAKEALIARLEVLVEAHHGDAPLDSTPPVGWKVAGFEDRIDDPELLKKLRSLGYVK